MLRLLFLLAALALAAPASAQEAMCVNGFATLAAPVPGAPTSGPFPCLGVDLLAYLPTCVGQGCTTGPLKARQGNDIWGWTDPESGREYALVGMINSTVFVDVTVPTAPQVLGRVVSHNNTSSTWRDIKVYADHAFIVSEASSHGMQVFDLRRLRGLTPDVNRTFAPDARYTGIGSAHNIVINEATGFAYAVGARQSGFQCNQGGLHMINIQTPTAPTYAGCFDTDGYTHDAQCIVYDGPDTAYTGREVCFNANEDTLTIVDVTDKSAPVMISRTAYPTPGYTHQGWLTEDRRYMLLNDELDEVNGLVATTRTIVMDVQSLANAGFHFSYLAAVPTSDHNLYIRGRYAYLSNYESGTRILDIAGLDAGVATEVAFFDTYPQGNGASFSFNGQWSNYPFFASGTLIANDRSNGLFVLRPSTLMVTQGPAPGAPTAFALSEVSPNPATGRAVLALSVPAPERVRVTLLDATGREVAVLHDGTVAETARFATDVRGLPAGFYVVRVVGETFTATRRLSVAH